MIGTRRSICEAKKRETEAQLKVLEVQLSAARAPGAMPVLDADGMSVEPLRVLEPMKLHYGAVLATVEERIDEINAEVAEMWTRVTAPRVSVLLLYLRASSAAAPRALTCTHSHRSHPRTHARAQGEMHGRMMASAAAGDSEAVCWCFLTYSMYAASLDPHRAQWVTATNVASCVNDIVGASSLACARSLARRNRTARTLSLTRCPPSSTIHTQARS